SPHRQTGSYCWVVAPLLAFALLSLRSRPRTRDACLRTSGCRRCRPDAPPAAPACAACDHRRRLGPSRLGGRPSALGGLAGGSRSPSAEARPQGRRLHLPPGVSASFVIPLGSKRMWVSFET